MFCLGCGDFMNELKLKASFSPLLTPAKVVGSVGSADFVGSVNPMSARCGSNHLKISAVGISTLEREYRGCPARLESAWLDS